MGQDRASTEIDIEKAALVKEAVDALSQLDEEEKKKTFDYFQSLINFYTNGHKPGT